MSKIIPPEFILIPYILIENEGISSLDERLYGIIYWFTQLKREKCVASNPVLAKLVKTTTGAIQNSLTNLEKHNYIKRIFKDKNRRNRLEIIPLIVLTRVSPPNDRGNKVSPTDDTVSPTGDRQVSPTGEENNKIINKSNKEDIHEQSSITILSTKKRQELTANIIKDFKKVVKDDFGFTPDTDKSDFVRVYTITGKYKEKELREIMNYYFDSEKYENKKFAKRPRVAFSVDTINKYKQDA